MMKVDKFNLYKGPALLTHLLNINCYKVEPVSQGSIVYAKKTGQTIELGERINGGGEAEIYKCKYDDEKCVKIYEKISQFKIDKIEKLLTFTNPNKQICMPIDFCVNKDKKIIGIIMPYIKGKSMLRTIKVNVNELIPTFDRKTQVSMIIDILEQIKSLHDANILLGDISLDNIMFEYNNENPKDSTFKTHLIDIDSCQIDKYNCTLTKAGYDAPEVITSQENGDDPNVYKAKDKDNNLLYMSYYQTNYRTFNMEYYAIAVLLFRLMMFDIEPYEHYNFGQSEYIYTPGKGFIDENAMKMATLDDIVNYNFSYSDISNEKTYPDSNFANIWSIFPYFLKKAFVDVFKNKKRLNVNQWIRIFKEYEKILTNGSLEKVYKDCNIIDSNIDEIEYNLLKDFKLIEDFSIRSFSFKNAIKKICIKLEDENLKKFSNDIADKLKSDILLSIGDYKFKLIYNLGFMKKIKVTVT